MSFWNSRLGKSFRRGRGRWGVAGGAAYSVGVLGIVLLLLFALVLWLAFWPRGKIYTLDISTEVISFVIADPLYSEWDISGGDLYRDPFDDANIIQGLGDFSVLSLNKYVSVEVQRHGVGPVRIKLSCDGGSIGRVEDENGNAYALGEWALITQPLVDKPLVLPFRGHLSIGEDVASLVDSILLGGTISIVEEKKFTRGHYTAGQETLDRGDRVQLWVNRSPKEMRSNSHPGCGTDEQINENKMASRLDGFVRAEPASFSEAVNALQLIAHGKADFARVERLGSAGYEVRAQSWVRFVNDPVLGALVAGLATLALLMEIFFKFLEFRKALNARQERRER